MGTSHKKTGVGTKYRADQYATHKSYYAQLKVGETVHYQESKHKFIRCQVVQHESKIMLKCIGLVGAWNELELPRQIYDSSVFYPHYAEYVRIGYLFTPNALNIYECQVQVGKVKATIDPRTLPAVGMVVPKLTQRQAKLWQAVHAAKAILADKDMVEPDPARRLSKVMDIIHRVARETNKG